VQRCLYDCYRVEALLPLMRWIVQVALITLAVAAFGLLVLAIGNK
jgi:hypothetical protein